MVEAMPTVRYLYPRKRNWEEDAKTVPNIANKKNSLRVILKEILLTSNIMHITTEAQANLYERMESMSMPFLIMGTANKGINPYDADDMQPYR